AESSKPEAPARAGLAPSPALRASMNLGEPVRFSPDNSWRDSARDFALSCGGSRGAQVRCDSFPELLSKDLFPTRRFTMFTAVAFLAALGAAPGQADTLALSDARITAGILGPARPRAKFLPGDSPVISFEIDGIPSDDAGLAGYSTSTEITDGNGKVVFRGPARDQQALAMLGGAKLPAYAQVDVGLDQPPGEYAVKITVTDLASKKSQT